MKLKEKIKLCIAIFKNEMVIANAVIYIPDSGNLGDVIKLDDKIKGNISHCLMTEKG